MQQAGVPAQQPSAAQTGPFVGYPAGVGLSPSVADLAEEAPAIGTTGSAIVVKPLYELPLGPEVRLKPDTTTARANATDGPEPDGALQDLAPAPNMPATGVSFDGVSSQDNFDAYGSRFVPPDTNGEVGKSHYVQVVNNLVGVYDKSGSGVPVTPPFKMSSLFASLGGICSTNNNGDPIVLYDQLADRWLLTQFAFTSPSTPPFHQCIAVSTTADPVPTAGAYHVYDFVMPGSVLNDYSKLGVWPDGYYMTDNQFTTTGGFAGVGVFAFDRAKMLAGDTSASFLYFNIGAYFAVGANLGGMLPADLDGPTPPPAGTPNYFAMLGTRTSYFASGGATDTMRLFAFHADFANPAASTFIERPESPVAVAIFDTRSPTGRNDIEQPAPAGSTAYLDAIQDRLMHRLAYRNFGGTRESLVVTHTVNVGANPVNAAGHQAAIRYYEFRRSLPGGVFTVPEQATFAPDADNRWMGSAAMDKQGNLAIGYSVSSMTTYPSMRYAGRLATDPPNGLHQGEATVIDGSGVQLSTTGRWGDYSALTVDPIDDCTFWYTNQYYTAVSQTSSTAGWLTRIGSFKFPGCVGDPAGTITGSVREVGTNTPIANAKITAMPDGFTSYTDATGFYTQSVPPATYTLTASAPPGHGSQSIAGVNVSNGAVTPTDFTLPVTVPPSILTQPASTIVAAGGDASFTVAASGIPAPGYQWQVSANAGTSWTTLTETAPYSGTTSATLVVTGATVGLNGAQYRSVATNSAGAATSAAATLTVTAGTLTGHVTDAVTSAAIANALVSVSPGGLTATTDATGLYTRAVPPGTFTVTASAPNYLSAVASIVVVTNGNTTTRDFALALGTTTSFDGLSSQDNQNVYGSRGYPPDTNGEVGKSHYVQMVNRLVGIYDKSGTLLTPAFKLSSLFASLGGICSTNDNGDPIVLYDQLADRWILSQFAFASPSSPPYHECVAVSTTGDPTGQYFAYDFIMPGSHLNDYPKLGMWPDAYYMTDNQFTNGATFAGAGVFAFDRAKMLAGDPSASYIYFNLGTGYYGVLPADLDGTTPPAAGTPSYFATLGDTDNTVRLFGFHVDFANPSASTFTEVAGSPVTVTSFDLRSPISAGRRVIEQPPPATASHYLDAIQPLLMHRLAYRNFGTHESLVVTHTINVGPDPTTVDGHQAAIRYYEFRRPLPGGTFAVNEQATFAPDADNRWMGSAAMDGAGNLAVGYSVSSLTTFPSIRYASRLATDPPNGLFQGEAEIATGSGVQLGTAGRWGDYSAMTVDPTDDCTFWYTTEYYTAASQASSIVGWVTRIARFRIPTCGGALAGTITGHVRDLNTSAPIAHALVTIAPNGPSVYTDATGLYTQLMPPGTYSVTASAQYYTTEAATGVLVTNGGTTTSDLALTFTHGTLSGHVRDASTNAPIPGALVSINPGGLSATTDATGLYTKIVLPGTYTLSAAASGYVAASPVSGVAVVQGGTTTSDFALIPLFVQAAYDSTLKAPRCASVAAGCDSGTTLLLGRDSMTGGAEPNQPNTILNSCADGTAGTFHVDESVDRLRIATTDGSALGPGKTVTIETTVWVFSTGSDRLDVYYAADATSPSWTFVATLAPTASQVSQVLSTTFVLPAGGLQAVRAQFRYGGSVSACTTGSYNDHDDLIFTGDTTPTAPAFYVHPSSPTVAAGYPATFSAAASAYPAPTFQWQVSTDNGISWTSLSNIAPYDGVTTATLTVSGVTAALNNYQFRAVATNSADSATSNTATLTVINPLTITTFAGLGGSSGSADGTGSAARFNNPVGVAVDSAGSVYVADVLNHTIRKITSAGVVSMFAGLAGSSGSADGTGSAARFYEPGGVAVDNSTGTFYVADTSNHTIRKITPAGAVTTFAGLAGASGSTDGTGSAARFNTPVALAFDNGTGTIYVADTGNSTIRKVTSAGVVTTLAGAAGNIGSTDGTGSAARFYQPYGIAVDPAGVIYVADTGNSTIRKVTSAGAVTTLAGEAGSTGSTDGTGSAARFDSPLGVAADSTGLVCVADTDNSTIRRVTPGGTVTTLAGSPGLTGTTDGTGSAARFTFPFALVVDGMGTVFVGDTFNHTIRKGVPGAGVSVPPTITFQPPNQIVDEGQNATFTVVASGTPTPTFQWQVSTNGGVSFANLTNTPPYANVTTPTLFIASATAGLSGYRYRAIATNSAGSATSTAATLTVNSAGAPVITVQPSSQAAAVGGSASFTVAAIGTPAPGYLWQVSTDGGISFSDLTNTGPYSGVTTSTLMLTGVTAAMSGYRFQCVASSSSGVATSASATLTVTSTLTFTTLAGSGGHNSIDGTGTAARFFLPWGVVVDSAGAAYVADANSHTIRKVTAAGVVTTVAGVPGSVGSADGTGAAARLNFPRGLAIDAADNIYIADATNHTIRKMTPAGVVTTVAGRAGYSGSADGLASAARFNLPYAVAMDSAGTLYVAEIGNDTIRTISSSGVVSTLAGLAGTSGSTDGTGPAARFSNPEGIAVDTAGTVYVADSANNTIRRITAAGVVTTLAGTAGPSGSTDGTGSAARFSFPLGIALNSAGTILYVADPSNYTIRAVVTSTGVVTTLAGLAAAPGTTDGTGNVARFYLPRGVFLSTTGTITVTDSGNDMIRTVTTAGVTATVAGATSFGAADGVGGAAKFFFPRHVAVDGAGAVYVADSTNHTVRRVAADGTVTTLAGLAGVSGSVDAAGSAARFLTPYGAAVDSAGNVYVSTAAHTIRKITPGGVVTTFAGSAGSAGSTDGTGSAATFNFPRGVAVDGAGTVYVTEFGNDTIRKITAAGVVTTLAGTAGSPGSADGTGAAARFNNPEGIAVDISGNVYVADSLNHTIRKITAAGVVTTLAGLAGAGGSLDGTGSAARFSSPGGVAVDLSGNVYVADTGNHTIRRISATGDVTTLAGLAGVTGSTDGAASAARFYAPSGVAVDGAGNVYVGDTTNSNIRKGTP